MCLLFISVYLENCDIYDRKGQNSTSLGDSPNMLCLVPVVDGRGDVKTLLPCNICMIFIALSSNTFRIRHELPFECIVQARMPRSFGEVLLKLT